MTYLTMLPADSSSFSLRLLCRLMIVLTEEKLSKVAEVALKVDFWNVSRALLDWTINQ